MAILARQKKENPPTLFESDFLLGVYDLHRMGGLRFRLDQDVLPTFLPEDLSIEMNSPIDVAKFIAKLVVEEDAFFDNSIYEHSGPGKYSPRDVANIFSRVLNKPVSLQVISQEKWQETLLSAGFSNNTAANLIDMTRALVENTVGPERPDDVIKLPTTLDDYLMRDIMLS